MKRQHWRGFPAKNAWKAAPVLEFAAAFLGQANVDKMADMAIMVETTI